MNLSYIKIRIEIALKAHVLNWFWRPRMKRRARRNEVLASVTPKYLKRYLSAVKDVPNTHGVKDKNEKIWSIWLQGKDAAPPLVQACYRSVARNCPQEHVVLDEKTLFDYIQLPEYIMEKRACGKISHAHFADIARVELLYQYGGIWMDSTGFVTDAPPSYFTDPDFFAYLVDQKTNSGWQYSFMQNCFMGARKGSYLLAAWRAMILEYWKCEPQAIDYMVHQLMFKTLVENDPRAKIEFAKMPHIYQDPTHKLWWDWFDKPFDQKVFDDITSEVWVQKTTYRGDFAPGTFAYTMIKM